MVGEREGPVRPLDRYLSPLDVWGMAFGCMVGWGVFAMPGSTFLPIAGPAGTLISLLIGMVIMLVIARSITYFMSRTSITGGMYSYIKEAFGRGVAFLGSWFLCLSYLTIVFLNGTAVFFVIRTIFDGVLLGSPQYVIAGTPVYLWETIASLLVLACIGILFIVAKPVLQKIQTSGIRTRIARRRLFLERCRLARRRLFPKRRRITRCCLFLKRRCIARRRLLPRRCRLARWRLFLNRHRCCAQGGTALIRLRVICQRLSTFELSACAFSAFASSALVSSALVSSAFASSACALSLTATHSSVR